MVTWQIKGVIFPLSQDLWTPQLPGWWLRMREPYPQVTWHIDHVVMWQIKNVIYPLSQDLRILNLAGWRLRKNQLHAQSHVTDQSGGHVTIQKHFIFTFTRRKAHKLSKVVTSMRRPRPTCHLTPWSHFHVTTIQ